MHTKNTKARITIDLPINTHKQLKTTAAILGKTMREIIIESLKLNPQFNAQQLAKKNS